MVKIIIRLLFFVPLLYISIRLYLDPEFWSPIHYVNLIFHEAGHAIFSFFGEFLQILGGTLFEFGIPLGILLYFLAKRDTFAAAFSAWWLSTAWYGISIYAGDGRAQQLPLLGGDAVQHDWFYLLNQLGLIRYDHQVAGVFVALSLVSLLYSLWLLNRNIKTMWPRP